MKLTLMDISCFVVGIILGYLLRLIFDWFDKVWDYFFGEGE